MFQVVPVSPTPRFRALGTVGDLYLHEPGSMGSLDCTKRRVLKNEARKLAARVLAVIDADVVC